MSILDDVRPLGEMKGMMPGIKRMAFGGQSSLSEPPPVNSTPTMDLVRTFNDGGNSSDDPLMPRFDQFTPEEKQRLDEEIYRNYFFDFLNNYMRDKELEEDPYYKDEMDKYNREQRGIPEVVPAGGINRHLDDIKKRTYGDRLMAQYNKNMNGGIMGGNIQGGLNGIPKKFNI